MGERRDSRDVPGADLSHVDAAGDFRMVDVGGKEPTDRRATAAGRITLGERAFALLAARALPKGDALAAARLAAIQAVKNTGLALPLCHPLPVDGIDVAWTMDAAARAVDVRVEVRCHARTGVEMEALHGASLFLLTIYDMAKAVDREAVISDLRLVAKSGGRSGDYRREDFPEDRP